MCFCCVDKQEVRKDQLFSALYCGLTTGTPRQNTVTSPQKLISSVLLHKLQKNQRSDGGTHPLLRQVVGRQLVLTEERRRKTRKMSSSPTKLRFVLVLAVTNGTIPDYIILIKRPIGYRGQNSDIKHVRRSHKQEITHQTLLASCLGFQSPCRTAFWEYFWFHLS